VHYAKVALDEALRLSDEIWNDLEGDEKLLEFSEQRLPGFDIELDSAIEALVKQQAALLQMSAQLDACIEAPSGAAFPKSPEDDTRAPGSQLN
jgi:hypothetical protein